MYNIQMLSSTKKNFSPELFKDALLAAISKDGRFRVLGSSLTATRLTRKERVEAQTEVYVAPTLLLKRIRLTTAKPYCGNHPGECAITGDKKRNTTYLEWEDWVAFHGLVNKVCDKFKLSANIWTLPPDVRGKMWIRKGLLPRLRYDHTDDWSRGNVRGPLRVWNAGDASQF